MAALDYADAIKRSLTMRQVAEYYGFTIHRGSKIVCPFHNDTHPSLQIYPGRGGFHCFVCNENGDVISFVQKLFGLSFMDACKKIDQDFMLHLNVGESRSREERKAAERAYQERLERKRQEEMRRERAFCLYNAAYNRYTFLDILKRENTPTDPNKPISHEYIYACRYIDEAWYDVEQAASAIRDLEKGEAGA